VIVAARLFPGPNNGLAYAVAPIEDRVKIVAARDLSEIPKGAVVLYSLSTPLFVEYWREVAEAARRHVVVVGGPHAAGDPISLLRLGVKYVVVGDGEAALSAILARESGQYIETPPNTVVFEDNRIKAGRRVYVELIHKTYSKALGLYPPVEITRSCGYRCAFCQTWTMGRVRHRPLENVAELVKEYVAAGFREIRFIAPVGFLYGSHDGKTPNIDALVALVKTVRELGGAPYLGTFPSETRPETITDDVLRALRPYLANRRIALGLQTASERLLRKISRGHGVAEVEEAVATARRHGFKPVVDIIGGLPGEEEDDVVDTVREMERLVSMGAYIRLHYYIPLPGTPLWPKPPAPPHPHYWDFIKRHKKKVEGYWEEQIELSKKILDTYRQLATLSLKTPSSAAN
jgi:B12-binding domain/radical SAM domain protein